MCGAGGQEVGFSWALDTKNFLVEMTLAQNWLPPQSRLPRARLRRQARYDHPAVPELLLPWGPGPQPGPLGAAQGWQVREQVRTQASRHYVWDSDSDSCGESPWQVPQRGSSAQQGHKEAERYDFRSFVRNSRALM